MNETMKSHVADFSRHLEEAIKIGNALTFKPTVDVSHFSNIIITGLGGSGIGGKIISQLIAGTCPLPIYVNNDYLLPAFVGPKTLVIACSYSGNTEETIASVYQAITAGAEVYCITSGGKLAEIANERKFGLTLIPAGIPPRAAFGLGFPQVFYALNLYGVITRDFERIFNQAISLFNAGEEEIKQDAFVIAEKLHGKTVVLYAEAGFEGVAIRIRQQLNENSKILCWHHVLPEMNHNELVGWAGGSEDIVVVLLKNESDFYRTKERFEYSKTVFNRYTSNIIEINSQGDSNLLRSLYLIHLTDWASCYLADLNNVDAVEIEVIINLKSRLAQF